MSHTLVLENLSAANGVGIHGVLGWAPWGVDVPRGMYVHIWVWGSPRGVH